MRCSNNSLLATIVLSVWAVVSNARRLSPQAQQHLLRHAIPVDASGNRRQLDQEQEDEDFELSGAYTIQFHKCASVSAQPADDSLLFGDDFIQYTSEGRIAAQKSYILFNICRTKYCDYYAGDENLFMVDVTTYMNAITVYYQERTEGYCEACLESQNYCTCVSLLLVV